MVTGSGSPPAAAHPHQAALLMRLEHDHTVGIPRPAGADTGFTDHGRATAANRDALQLVVGEERQFRT